MVFEKIDFDFEISKHVSFKCTLQLLFCLFNVEFEFIEGSNF